MAFVQPVLNEININKGRADYVGKPLLEMGHALWRDIICTYLAYGKIIMGCWRRMGVVTVKYDMIWLLTYILRRSGGIKKKDPNRA